MFLMREVPLYRTLAWEGEGARPEDSNNHGGAQYTHREARPRERGGVAPSNFDERPSWDGRTKVISFGNT